MSQLPKVSQRPAVGPLLREPCSLPKYPALIADNLFTQGVRVNDLPSRAKLGVGGEVEAVHSDGAAGMSLAGANAAVSKAGFFAGDLPAFVFAMTEQDVEGDGLFPLRLFR